MRRGRFSGLRHGRGNGVRKGGQPCLGFAGSRWVRYQATFVRWRVREATYGGWVGARGRSKTSFSVVGLGSGGTGTGVRVRTYGKLSKVAVRGGMCNSHRGGAERHEEGEERVGVRRRAGRGVCVTGSWRGGRAAKRVRAALGRHGSRGGLAPRRCQKNRSRSVT